MGMLIEIDDQRVDYKFVGEDGTAPDEGQSVRRHPWMSNMVAADMDRLYCICSGGHTRTFTL